MFHTHTHTSIAASGDGKSIVDKNKKKAADVMKDMRKDKRVSDLEITFVGMVTLCPCIQACLFLHVSLVRGTLTSCLMYFMHY